MGLFHRLTVLSRHYNTLSLSTEELPAPQLEIRTAGISTAGRTYTLTCTAVVVENLVVEPTVAWRFFNRSTIVGGNGISAGSPMTSGNTTTLTLTFDRLRNSHAGQYACSANVTAKSIILSSSERVADVIVQSKLSVRNCVMWCCLHDYLTLSSLSAVPAPTVTISPVQPQPYNGTYFNLSCTITLDPAVNTAVNVTGTWSKSGNELTTDDTTCITISETRLVTTNPSTYQTLLQFEPLGNDSTDGGSYICEATVIPSDAQFVTNTSMRDEYELDVQGNPTYIHT